MTKQTRVLLILAVLSVAPAMAEAAFITFGATTVNPVEGPVAYSFLFGTPIVPGFYTEASLVGEVTVTPGTSGAVTIDPSAVYPTYLSGYGTLGLVPTNLGVDLGTTTCTTTAAAVTCSFSLITNTFPPTFYDNLEALLTYNQTGRGSTVAWSGNLTLSETPSETVPEPSLVVLLALGGLWGFRRFRLARA